MVAAAEIAQRQAAPRPHSVGAVPQRQRAAQKQPLMHAKTLQKMPTDESLQQKEKMPIRRCASEVVLRPGTAPAPGAAKKFMRSSTETDAAFQLSHLKRSASYSMPRCPSRGALSVHRNSWYPLTSSQMKGGTGPGPAEANLARITHKGKFSAGPSHSIGTAPRFRSKSQVTRGRKPMVEGDGFVLKTYTAFGQQANHPMRAKSPACSFPKAPRFFSAW